MSENWLYRGSVVHTRLKPVRHHFRYPAFFICFPLSRKADLRHGLFSLERFNLFSYHESDHGDGRDSAAWVRGILARFGIAADGEIWLQAQPRMLGFVFNPVSFWYCEDRAGVLRAVVCEVNNTFGERHCYLLTAPEGGAISADTDLRAQKLFHVSPFFPVEGEYRFRFRLEPSRRTVRIDYWSDGEPTLMTALSGEARPLANGELLRTVASLGWSTLLVVVRIHWQALKLWLKGAKFHPKPVPPHQEVSS